MPREVRRCLVIDAQPTVRLGVRNLLGGRYEVAEASDWSKGLEMVTQVDDFDVAIVDMSRNGAAAIEGDDSPVAAIRALRRARSGLGIVAHGARPHRLAATDALNAGATAYVAKSSAPDELASAVDAAAESERFVDPAAQRQQRSPRLHPHPAPAADPAALRGWTGNRGGRPPAGPQLRDRPGPHQGGPGPARGA